MRELAHITLEAILAAHPHGDVAAVVIGQPAPPLPCRQISRRLVFLRFMQQKADDALAEPGVTETDVISKNCR